MVLIVPYPNSHPLCFDRLIPLQQFDLLLKHLDPNPSHHRTD